IAYADYSWGQSTRDAYAAEIKKNGGEIVGTTGIPIGTADMTPFLSKISGNFDGRGRGHVGRPPGLSTQDHGPLPLGRLQGPRAPALRLGIHARPGVRAEEEARVSTPPTRSPRYRVQTSAIPHVSVAAARQRGGERKG
ncbi:MAG: ABC transporter substrate-binding protein, partial [Acidobacteriia bacterium]|nr:ABC transporter substrate-binding protein [Terriglobia bacterium]